MKPVLDRQTLFHAASGLLIASAAGPYGAHATGRDILQRRTRMRSCTSSTPAHDNRRSSDISCTPWSCSSISD
jgi:hypothetical protein